MSTRPTDGVIVTCTNRGSHPRRELAVFLETPAPSGRRTVNTVASVSFDATRELPLGDAVDDFGNIDDIEDRDYRRRFRLNCPSCPRDEQWRIETAERVVLTLLKAGITSIDLSDMPANLRSS
jgi:hypothetical protein